MNDQQSPPEKPRWLRLRARIGAMYPPVTHRMVAERLPQSRVYITQLLNGKHARPDVEEAIRRALDEIEAEREAEREAANHETKPRSK